MINLIKDTLIGAGILIGALTVLLVFIKLLAYSGYGLQIFTVMCFLILSLFIGQVYKAYKKFNHHD